MNATAIVLALIAIGVRIDAHGDSSFYAAASAALFISALVFALYSGILEQREREK